MKPCTFLVITLFFCFQYVAAQECDKSCLENIAERYLAAYVKHDTGSVPIRDNVRFTENSVEMGFPDASWDTVTEETGPALVLSDVRTGNIGIFTAIMQNDTPGFLAVRLKVEDSLITEIEHMLSTRRNLSGPPTPIGNVNEYTHNPVINELVPQGKRISRERMAAHAAGYFSTLQRNDGEIRGTRFTAEATRNENGLLFENIEQGFRSGFYAFNDRVRHEVVLVDEERGVVMARGFIDHKGVLDEYTLTDGRKVKSVYREPHSWAFLEMFKIKDDHIVAVTATFIGVPYNMSSPWTSPLDP